MNTVAASFLEDFLAIEVGIGHAQHQANPLVAAAAVVVIAADTFVDGGDAYYRV